MHQKLQHLSQVTNMLFEGIDFGLLGGDLGLLQLDHGLNLRHLREEGETRAVSFVRKQKPLRIRSKPCSRQKLECIHGPLHPVLYGFLYDAGREDSSGASGNDEPQKA